MNISRDQAVPTDVLARWIDESFRLLAPRQLAVKVASGPAEGGVASRKKVARR